MMKSVVSRALLVFSAGISISSFSVYAQQSMTVVISGEILEESCTPTVIGLTGGTLSLPAKTLSQINVSDPSVPGSNITFSVANCTQNNMWAHFTATDIDNGRINTNNSQVAFQIRDLNSGVLGGQVNVGGTAAATGPTSNQGTGVAITGGVASKSYAVHYYRKVPAVTQTGAVTANTIYTVKYY